MDDLDLLIQRRFRIRPDDISPCRALKRACRDVLAALFAEAGFASGVEVGVAHGDYSLVLCQAIPGLRLLCVDPWTAYQSGSVDKLDAASAVVQRQEAQRRLAPYTVVFQTTTSAQAVLTVPVHSLDFAVLDGDHEFDGAMCDLIAWSARVRVGGIVAVHDYDVAYRVGVMEAVNAYTRAHAIGRWYLTRDRVPYAFWVNP